MERNNASDDDDGFDTDEFDSDNSDESLVHRRDSESLRWTRTERQSELNLAPKTMWKSVGEMEHNEHYIDNALFLVVFVVDDFFS